MTRIAIGLASLRIAAFLPVSGPHGQQAGPPAQDIIVYAHVFAANPADPSSTQVVGTPTFRIARGRTATADLRD